MHVNHPLIKPESIEARIYQQLVVASALKQNTLCVLGTGLGKTAIAALTIAGILSKQDGKVLIIAPSRPLVDQHFKSMNQFLNIDSEKIVILNGKISPKKRETMWESGKIFIATPQVAENDIISKILKPSQFSLLIADEAHHTTGNHSYTFVANKFKKKSHVLGLTASPGSNIERIIEICGNLGIEHVEIKTEEDPDVSPYVAKVKMRPRRVELPEEFGVNLTLLKNALKDRLRDLKENRVIHTINVNKSELLGLNKRIMSMDDNIKYEMLRISSEAVKLEHAIEMLETQGRSTFLNYYQKLLTQNTKSAKEITNDPRFIQVVKNLNELDIEHPKYEKMLEIVSEILKENEKIIIFAQYRDTVQKIVDLLSENEIEAIMFVGQSNKDGKGMSQKEQAKAIEKFKNEANVLVSTSVSEEGIDISSVNYVLFYEPVPSEIRMIQRRGRAARGEGGQVIVLIAEKTRDEGYYRAGLAKEKNMKNILKNMQTSLNKKLKELHEEKVEKTENKDHYLDLRSVVNSKTSAKSEEKKPTKLDKKSRNGLPNKATIIVDSRERHIGRYLSERAEVEFKTLEIGDYILSDRVVVERKTAEDFENSIIDKRLFNQIMDLKKYERPLMIIEGNEFVRIHENAIRGMMFSIMIDYQIPIMFSRDIEDTADILVKLAEREQIKEKREISIRYGKRPMSLKERQKFLVEGLPDVGPVMAENLLDNFNSVENIFTATEEELKAVEGMGPVTAKKIKEVVTKNYRE
ncbi:ERCC4 domain protein [Methanococcus maripaludis C5]|uniref:ERCC4 domain protein n=1 Tax=Methanococcus maripaludis (strain C5 / ATCC BAA-1333) TaxID=402880 RepID=A4FWC5_METM5|nr:DEAD/DEAH box helicase [Methanococcus maripaludis]ABO34500.1 ERCC4 domain protein [Methanococcus maripaludis C5]